MQTKILLILTIGLFARVNNVAANCQISEQQLNDERRIFAIRHGNGPLQLLRKTNVPQGTELVMVCNVNDQVITRCVGADFQPVLPIQKECKNVLKSTTEKLDKGEDCKGELYRIGYRLSGQEFLELYRTCFTRALLTHHWSKHTAYANMVSSRRPSTPNYALDEIYTPNEAESFKKESVFQRFREMFGDKYMKTRDKDKVFITRGHLTPASDMAFYFNKYATFKLINMAPQFQLNNLGNWQLIEDWVKQRLREVPEATVTTGALGVLSLPDDSGMVKSVYLLPNNRNPIPKWVYKIVSDSQGQHIFLSYNNIYDSERPTPNFCTPVNCPKGLGLVDKPKSGFSYCCSALNVNLANY